MIVTFRVLDQRNLTLCSIFSKLATYALLGNALSVRSAAATRHCQQGERRQHRGRARRG
jgi:hypothetical protein